MVRCEPGLTLARLETVLDEQLRSSSPRPRRIFVLAGLCDMTRKLDSSSGVEVIQPLSIQQQTFVATMRAVNRMVTSFGVALVWVESPPMSLYKANIGFFNIGSATALPHHHQYRRMQAYHENLMRRYNACAVYLNTQNGSPTLFFGKPIQHCQYGQFTYRYCHLGDGIHPSNSTTQFWGRRLQTLLRRYP